MWCSYRSRRSSTARQDRSARQRALAADLARRATEADQRIKRLYDVIVAGVADLDDPALKDRSA